MSFDKLNATANPVVPASIRFLYPTDKIFNSVSLRTSYRANMIKDQGGESQLDDIAISAQEKDIVLEFMADAIFEISTSMFKLTDGIDQSVFVDTLKTLVYNGAIIDDANYTDAAAEPVAPEEGNKFVVTVAWGEWSIGDKLIYMNGEYQKVTVKASGFSIKNNAAFNSNVLPSLDKKLESCIKYFIMREWYGSVGLEKDMALAQQSYLQNFIKAKNLTFQLRKPLMT